MNEPNDPKNSDELNEGETERLVTLLPDQVEDSQDDMGHNANLEQIYNVVVGLDPWDVGSVLGAVKYLLLQAAINQAIRLIPNDLEREGKERTVDQYAEYENAMKNPEIREKAAPFLGAADRVQALLNDYSTAPPTTLATVIQFMTQTAPRDKTFVDEYKRREAKGLKPDIPIGQFVAREKAIALARHDQVKAKGSDAVQILEQTDGTDSELPEWAYDAILMKILQKLNGRWEHHETRRTNDRLPQVQQDEALTNKKLVEAAILQLGGEVPNDKAHVAAMLAASIAAESKERNEKFEQELAGKNEALALHYQNHPRSNPKH